MPTNSDTKKEREALIGLIGKKLTLIKTSHGQWVDMEPRTDWTWLLGKVADAWIADREKQVLTSRILELEVWIDVYEQVVASLVRESGGNDSFTLKVAQQTLDELKIRKAKLTPPTPNQTPGSER